MEERLLSKADTREIIGSRPTLPLTSLFHRWECQMILVPCRISWSVNPSVTDQVLDLHLFLKATQVPQSSGSCVSILSVTVSHLGLVIGALRSWASQAVMEDGLRWAEALSSPLCYAAGPFLTLPSLSSLLGLFTLVAVFRESIWSSHVTIPLAKPRRGFSTWLSINQSESLRACFPLPNGGASLQFRLLSGHLWGYCWQRIPVGHCNRRGDHRNMWGRRRWPWR